jgi:Flp pilus assembly protein CpaB
MMKVLLDIPNNKAATFMGFINTIPYVKTENVFDKATTVKVKGNKVKEILVNSPAIPNGEPLTATQLKALLLEAEKQNTTSFETIKKQWEKRKKQLIK